MSPREEKFCADKGIDSSKLPSFAFVVDGDLILYDEYEFQSSSSKAFHTFCMENMPKQYVNNINNIPQMEERLLFLSSSTKPKPNRKSTPSLSSVMLLTDKYETSSMFYSLSYYFRKDFVFGESRAKNLKLSQSFKVKKYPALFAFVPLPSKLSEEKYNDEYGLIRYSGPIKKDKIITWLGKIKTTIEKTGQNTAKRRTEL